MSFILEKVTAREILDSRGNPTVEVDAFTSDGMMAGHRYRLAPAPAHARRPNAVMAMPLVLAGKGP
jgi:enolase